MNSTKNFIDIKKLDSQLDEITNMVTVSPIENVYTLDLQQAKTKIFRLVSSDANAKSIVFTNAGADNSLITVSVLVQFTTACALTMPSGFTINGGGALPSASNGQSYWYAFDSIDGGTSGKIYVMRRS